MEDAFRRVVEHIFNNWTALKLAVEHGMGGPDSKNTALDFINYMTAFCLYEQNVDVSSIQEALEDILDQEFSTECEDNSTNEIANILFKFLDLVKESNNSEYETEFNKLPVNSNEWLIKSQTTVQEPPIQETVEDNTPTQVPMEQDEWTEVKTRRRKN